MFRTLTATAVLASAIFVATPSNSFADRFDTNRGRDVRHDDHRDDRRDDHRDNDHHDGGRVDIHIGGGSYERGPRVIVPPPVYEERVWVAPVMRCITEQVYVPASYTTVTDRVWVEPAVRKVEERAWIGDRYELRDVTHWEYGCRVTRRENVLVEAGHYGTICRDEVVAPGHYEDRPRQQLVCDAHYETVTRDEVIVPGHWEMRPTRVVIAQPRDEFHFDLRFPIGR